MPPDTPTFIGRYRVLDTLGEGAMGIVYRAEDAMLARQVAVKVMTEAIARQGDLRDRFLREARAAGSLQHPNIVTVYDFGEVEGHLFIAMELVDGADLAHLLSRHEPLPLDSKLGIVGDLLAGLAYAHKGGVVHRDIKPANVRVTSDGRAKIMDFGIAYVTSSDLTRTGLTLGTPSYMAPEQVVGEQVTPATDIFAAGVVLYELLAGVKPFAGPTIHSILFKIVSEPPPELGTLVPGLPPAVGEVVARALRKDPAERYQTALDMAQALGAARAAASGMPGQWTLSLRAAAPAAAVAPTATSIAPATGQSVATQPTATPSADTTAPAPTSTGRRPGLQPRTVWVSTGITACVLVLVAVWAARGRLAAATPAAAPAITVAAQPAAPSAGTGVPVSPGVPVSVGGTPAPRPAAGAAAPTAVAPPVTNRTPLRAATPPASQAATVPLARGTATPAPTPAVAGSPVTTPRSATSPVATTAPVAPAHPPTVAAASASPPGAATSAATGAPATAAEAPAPSPAAASAEIAEVARVYARAIESRDIAGVRRAYPGLTDAQERGFRQFFEAARNLHVTFAARDVDVTGPVADARLTGAYDYTTTDGQHQHQPVDFAAIFRREGGGWRLTSVR